MVSYEELVQSLQSIAGRKAKVPDGFKTIAEMCSEWNASEKSVRKVLKLASESGRLEVSRKVVPRIDKALKSVPIYRILNSKEKVK